MFPKNPLRYKIPFCTNRKNLVGFSILIIGLKHFLSKNTLNPYWQMFQKPGRELDRYTGKLIQSSIGDFLGATQTVLLENSPGSIVTYHVWVQSENSNG